MDYIKNFLKDKTIAFYIALGVGVLAIITAVFYAVVFSGTGYISWFAFTLMLVAPLAFIALSIFNMPRLGAGTMAGLVFIAALLSIRHGYGYVMEFFINGFTSEFTIIVTVVIMFFVTFIAGNAVAWLRHIKRGNTTADTAAAVGYKEGKR